MSAAEKDVGTAGGSEEGSPARPGALLRVKGMVGRTLQRALVVVSKLRKGKTSEEGHDPADGGDKAHDGSSVKRNAKGLVVMGIAGLAILAIGVAAGVGISYLSFSPRLAKQAAVIAAKSKELAAHERQDREAERVLEQVKAELSNARQALEATQAELQQSQANEAELEDRIASYANSRTRSRHPAVGRASTVISPATGGAVGQRGVRIRDGSCQVGSGSIGKDLSRCLGSQ